MSENNSPSIFQITLASFNIDQMKAFYEHVFNLKFESIKENGIKLEKALWNNIDLYLCPAEVAKITAEENRHQFHIKVNDIHKTVSIVNENGGKVLSDIHEIENIKMAHIKDPDNNSLVLKEV